MSEQVQTDASGVRADETNRTDAVCRWNFAESLRTETVFEKRGFDSEKRQIELAFSSEFPVERSGYREVLSHNPADMDLSRLNDSHPLLLNHDMEKQIGVVESARIDPDKKGRAVVRFSRSPLGEEIWKDVQDGIRRLVSVGYRRTREVETVRDGDSEVVRFAWQPYEISLVSVPADASVGIGRKQPISEPTQKKETTMSEKIEVTETAPKIDARVSEINSIASALDGKVDGIKEIAARAILDEKVTVAQFRDQVREILPAARPTTKPAMLNVEEKDIRGYSLVKAINQAADGKLDGLEREMHDEYVKRGGSVKGNLWVPYEAMARSSGPMKVETASLGGNLKGTTLLGNEFIDALRNRILVTRMGARFLSGLTGDIAIPRQYEKSTAYWASSEFAAVTASGPAYNQLSLAPKECIGLVQVSRKLMAQSTPSVEQLVRDDLTQEIAIAIDLAALHGAGASGEPSGVYASSTNLITYAANGVTMSTMSNLCRPMLISLESAVSTDNCDLSKFSFVTNPGVRGILRNAPVNTNASVFCWSEAVGAYGDGTVLGYPAYCTNQVKADRTVGSLTTASSIFFGDWSEVIVATWGGGLDLLVDPYVNASTRQINLYATQYVDVGLRHTDAVAVMLGLNATA